MLIRAPTFKVVERGHASDNTAADRTEPPVLGEQKNSFPVDQDDDEAHPFRRPTLRAQPGPQYDNDDDHDAKAMQSMQVLGLADFPAMSFVHICLLTNIYQNTNQLSWAINCAGAPQWHGEEEEIKDSTSQLSLPDEIKLHCQHWG